jgi:hypothetical protein
MADPDTSCANLDAMKRLLGNWRSVVGKNTFMEHWSLTEEGSFVGHAEAVAEDGGAVNFENLSLVERTDGVFYIADVPQNDGPVEFRLADCDSNTFTFKNPEHDFPQVIEYQFLEGGGIQAHIMTLQGDGFKLVFDPYDGSQ